MSPLLYLYLDDAFPPLIPWSTWCLCEPQSALGSWSDIALHLQGLCSAVSSWTCYLTFLKSWILSWTHETTFLSSNPLYSVFMVFFSSVWPENSQRQIGLQPIFNPPLLRHLTFKISWVFIPSAPPQLPVAVHRQHFYFGSIPTTLAYVRLLLILVLSLDFSLCL